jgi:hypothetical protein
VADSMFGKVWNENIERQNFGIKTDFIGLEDQKSLANYLISAPVRF